jgi:hypothetical protein
MLFNELYEDITPLLDYVRELDLLRKKMKNPGAGDQFEASRDFNELLSKLRDEYGEETYQIIAKKYRPAVSKPDDNIHYKSKPYSASDDKPKDDELDIKNINFKAIGPHQTRIANIRVRLNKTGMRPDSVEYLKTALDKELKAAKRELSGPEYKILVNNLDRYFDHKVPLPDYS